MFFYRENKLEKDIIDTNFAVEQNSFGLLKLHELKTGGRNIQLTEDNKKEYVKYVYIFHNLKYYIVLYVHFCIILLVIIIYRPKVLLITYKYICIVIYI